MFGTHRGGIPFDNMPASVPCRSNPSERKSVDGWVRLNLGSTHCSVTRDIIAIRCRTSVSFALVCPSQCAATQSAQSVLNVVTYNYPAHSAQSTLSD